MSYVNFSDIVPNDTDLTITSNVTGTITMLGAGDSYWDGPYIMEDPNGSCHVRYRGKTYREVESCLLCEDEVVNYKSVGTHHFCRHCFDDKEAVALKLLKL